MQPRRLQSSDLRAPLRRISFPKVSASMLLPLAQFILLCSPLPGLPNRWRDSDLAAVLVDQGNPARLLLRSSSSQAKIVNSTMDRCFMLTHWVIRCLLVLKLSVNARTLDF